jgi:hypothetical protein
MILRNRIDRTYMHQYEEYDIQSPPTLINGEAEKEVSTLSYASIAAESVNIHQLKEYADIANGLTSQRKPIAEEDGLPAHLQTGIESLSGIAMNDVRVHYNSSKPAQLQAHAYAQGAEIHLAPGQEKHLAHEAWHVVQQKQGRVKPTLQLKDVAVNDDTSLEREADEMGTKAMKSETSLHQSLSFARNRTSTAQCQPVVQRVVLSKVYKLIKGGYLTKYYSTYDKSKEFETYEEAAKLDAELEPGREDFDHECRYPTNFSYYNSRATSFPTVSRQGPHTCSHTTLSYRLNEALQNLTSNKMDVLVSIIKDQIPAPDEFKRLVLEEAPKGIGDDILTRMFTDYVLLYQMLMDFVEGKRTFNRDVIHEITMRLIQMHPYASYGKGKSTSKRNIKGKNERCDDPFEEAFDEGAKFRNKKEYDNFKLARQKLWPKEGTVVRFDEEIIEKEPGEETSDNPKKKVRSKEPSSGPRDRIMGEFGMDSFLIDSVAQFIQDSRYNLQRNLLVVSGRNWTCYIRCVLHQFGKIESYDEVMGMLNGKVNVDDGVEVGSGQEELIRTIISQVIGQQYFVTVTDVSHGHQAVSKDQNGTQVELLLTGAHFSLLL